MAELLIKIGDGASYNDGDVLCAFSDRAISCVHAQHICHHKRAKRNQSGLLLSDSLTAAFMDRVSQYRFERVSATEVERVSLTDGTRERFGAESIDVRLFVRRRRRNPNCVMFGEDGSEVWFGGRTDFSRQAINQAWRLIEQQTDKRRNDERHQLWSMGRLDIRLHLAVRVEALNDKQAADFVEPEYETDDNGEFVWELPDEERIKERGKSHSIDSPPDDRPGWQIKVASKRRQKAKWADMLADLQETAERVRDSSVAIGHEYDEPDGKRYTSKSQPRQKPSRIEKKLPKRQRGNR